MAEKVTMVSPLFEPGVHHTTVRSWEMGTPPDPLGILDPTGTEAHQITAGGGDDTNDWHAEFPDGGGKGR